LHRYVGPFLPRKARSTGAPTQFTNVYFKNVDEAVTKEQLEEIFVAHGKITNCVIMQNEKGESRGFGFVNFEKPEEAQQVCLFLSLMPPAPPFFVTSSYNL
jgi:polyadenylate-binding protein